MEKYKIKVITSVTEMDTVRSLWNTPHPLADYDFFAMIAQIRSVTPCVIVLYRDQEPVCLLIGRIETEKNPIRFGYARFGQISVRQLLFIAGGFLGEKTEAHWLRLLTFVDHLMQEQKIDLAIFEQINVNSFERDAVKKSFWRSLAKGSAEHWILLLMVFNSRA